MKKQSTLFTQFTPELLPAPNPRRIWINLVGSLLFILLFNMVVHFYLNAYTPNLAYWLVHHKWRTLQSMDEPLDWLILGDSSGNQGIVTVEFENLVNGSAYNFASAGAGVFLNDAWMLETYLERFEAPRGVVLVHIYDIWPRTERDWFMTRIPVPISDWDDYGIPIETTPREKINAYVLKYIPLYAQERTLASLFSNIFWGKTQLFSSPYHLEEGGYWKDPRSKSPVGVRNSTAEHIKWTNGTILNVSEVNQKSLEYMILLAEEHDFDLYYAVSPLHDELFAHENFQGYFLQFQDLLDEYDASHPNFHNLGLISTFPAEQGLDSDHVNHEAALNYTYHLALKLLAAEKEMPGSLLQNNQIAEWRITHSE